MSIQLDTRTCLRLVGEGFTSAYDDGSYYELYETVDCEEDSIEYYRLEFEGATRDYMYSEENVPDPHFDFPPKLYHDSWGSGYLDLKDFYFCCDQY